MEQQSNSLDEMAYTSKVAKFLGEGNILNPALSSNRDKSSLCPIEMEITWMEERILKGVRGLTIRLLTRKVGNLSDELLAKVSSLNLERVEALSKDLLDFKHVGDLDRWILPDR